MTLVLFCVSLFVSPVSATMSASISKLKKAPPPVIKTNRKKKRPSSSTVLGNQVKKGKSTGRFPALTAILKKWDLLPNNHRQSRYPAGFLKEELDTFLNEFGSVCSHPEAASVLISKMNHLRDFLKDKLQDPYMDDDMEILFSDILLLIGEDSSSELLKSGDFKSSYKVAFGIRGEINPADYPKWAAHIEKALTCVEEAADSE